MNTAQVALEILGLFSGFSWVDVVFRMVGVAVFNWVGWRFEGVSKFYISGSFPNTSGEYMLRIFAKMGRWWLGRACGVKMTEMRTSNPENDVQTMHECGDVTKK